MTRFIKAGEFLIPTDSIRDVDISMVEEGRVFITTSDDVYTAEGADAIEVVMLLKPSALEGRNLRWVRNAWAFHNIVGHPLMQILVWLGRREAAIRLHDNTTPHPR